jgi:hypothetical protein
VDGTTTRLVVPCTTVRVGILDDSAMTTFRLPTVRDGVSGELRIGLLGRSISAGTGIRFGIVSGGLICGLGIDSLVN